MKYLFLSAQLLFVTPLFAQHFEVGVDGGIVHYSVHNFYDGSTYENFARFQSSITTPFVSATAMYVTKHYQLGIGLGYGQLSYKCIPEHDVQGFATPITVQYSDREAPLKLFMNRKVGFKHFEAYGGISLDYIFVNSKSEIIMPPDWGTYKPQQSTERIGAGLQVGATYFITKAIGINAEADAAYNNFPSGPLDNNIVSFPVKIGVRYRF